MTRKVMFDIKCDKCSTIVENQYEQPSQPDYGDCPVCDGKMRQMIGIVHHTFKTPVDSVKGRTANGTKYEVATKVRKYNPATGGYK